jgi:hypothetical protein
MYGNNSSICEGDSAMLYVSGGPMSISWNTGETYNNIYVKPTTTTTYTFTATDYNGCKGTGEVEVTVNYAMPMYGNNSSICEGDSAMLYVSGGPMSISWNTGETYNNIYVKPTTTTTYTFTATDYNGCKVQ